MTNEMFKNKTHTKTIGYYISLPL